MSDPNIRPFPKGRNELIGQFYLDNYRKLIVSVKLNPEAIDYGVGGLLLGSGLNMG